jgi:periplasmic divalent cation tolerance protein
MLPGPLEDNGNIAGRVCFAFFVMTDKIVVLSTCASEEEAERIGRQLVEDSLAACVSFVPRLRSFYRWKGTIEAAEEVLLIIKSSQGLFDRLAARLQEIHSYEVPEVLSLPVTAGSEQYLMWMVSNLQPEQ